MLDEIRNSVKEYAKLYSKISDIANDVRNNLHNNKYSFFEEKNNINSISRNDTFSVAGSDSGFFIDNLTGLDFAYVKCAGSYIEYEDGSIKNYDRIPIIPTKDIYFSRSTLQKDELHKFVSIKRIQKEIKLLDQIITIKNPDLLLIDGNVCLQAVDRPQNNSGLYKEYKELVIDYVKLYDKVKSNNSILVGCVEDSRATTFIDKINLEEIRTNDTIFLDNVLKENEALSFFKTNESNQNIINQDLGEFGKFDFYISYLKPSEDYPLRIETISKDFNKIRACMGFMSGQIKNYSFPSILIDADKRAKLEHSEVEHIKSIINKEFLKLNIRKMRRNRRI